MAPSKDSAGLPAYSWKDVAQHNTEASAWVIVDNGVYDITDWMDKHPGGKEMLLLSAGRDVTELLVSYHPFSEQPAKYLASRQIGTVSEFEFPRFKPDSGFYKTVRARVGKYFADNKLNSKSPWGGLARMAPVFALAALSYGIVNHLLVPDASLGLRCATAVLLGICTVMPLLHTMHDASHTAIGNNETWWKIIGRTTMEWYAGASMLSWQHQHTVGHHLYTNLFGVDPDMPMTEEGDLRRIVPRQVWSLSYKYQHVFLPLLYGFLAIKFRIQDITDSYLLKTNGAIRVNYFGSSFVRLWAVKAFWVFYRIVLPLAVFKVPAAEFALTFLLIELASGYWLALNFQVSHISTVAEYPNGAPSSNTEEEWALMQVKTGVDYSHGSTVATYLSGALNYQVVHHLFPSVSQYYYPDIAPIVIDVCKQYKVPYAILPSFWSAFSLHVKHLKEMGAIGKRPHLD